MIAVTGLGAVTAQGWSVEAAWQGIENASDGLGRLTLFDSPRWGAIPSGQVPPHDDIDLAPSRSMSLAEHATRQALTDSGIRPEAEPIGLVVGACTGGMLEGEQFLDELIRKGEGYYDWTSSYTCAATTDHLAQRFGLTGPRVTVSNACASGASAIGLACDWLRAGRLDAVVAGGVDVLNRLVLNGFGSLLVLDAAGCRPFDSHRRGMSLGEGAAMLVLETDQHARRRGAEIHGFISGWATTCDAYHASGPHPAGDGVYRAMTKALHQADVRPESVGYVNAHGSGTVDNDRAEGSAICRLFNGSPPPVSSTKRFFGHTLGAAGAIEALVCLLALRFQRLPPNLGFSDEDPEIGFTPVLEVEDHSFDVALSNSAGFGGVNTSVVLTRLSP